MDLPEETQRTGLGSLRPRGARSGWVCDRRGDDRGPAGVPLQPPLLASAPSVSFHSPITEDLSKSLTPPPLTSPPPPDRKCPARRTSRPAPPRPSR